MINFCLRPTSLFLWAVIWPYELLTKKEGKILFIFKNGVQIVINCLFSVFVGSWWYGRWIWIDFNFFKVNLTLFSITSFLNFQNCMESIPILTTLSFSFLWSWPAILCLSLSLSRNISLNWRKVGQKRKKKQKVKRKYRVKLKLLNNGKAKSIGNFSS